MISYEEFSKIELKVARVLSAERVDGSEKLLKLQIDLGGEDKRQLIAGIGKAYESESLVGKEIVVVANLEPRKLMGLESQGMLLAASSAGMSPELAEGPVLLVPDKEISPGSGIK